MRKSIWPSISDIIIFIKIPLLRAKKCQNSTISPNPKIPKNQVHSINCCLSFMVVHILCNQCICTKGYAYNTLKTPPRVPRDHKEMCLRIMWTAPKRMCIVHCCQNCQTQEEGIATFLKHRELSPVSQSCGEMDLVSDDDTFHVTWNKAYCDES